MNNITKNAIALGIALVVLFGTRFAVQQFHEPGKLDVVEAQAMDMSQMRPPTGAAPVELTSVRHDGLAQTVTYTGSVKAYNEQDVSPRIAGSILSMPVYPGDTVRPGQLLAQLDSAEVAARTEESLQRVREAGIAESVAHLTHYEHHGAALAQANAQLDSAHAGVLDAQQQARASQDAIAEAQAGVKTAQANADYWTAQVAREKSLYDQGFVSRQAYEDQQAQGKTASAAVDAAQAKVAEAKANARAADAKVDLARRQVDAAKAGVQMAKADITIAEGQANQAGAETSVARASAREAGVVQGYTRIVSPVDGVVVDRPVSPGTLVQPGTVILKIAEIERVRVQANVAVDDLGGIHPGSPVTIAPSDGQPITAHVSAVFPAADSQTRTAIVEAVVPNPGHRLLPGAFVSMKIAKAQSAGMSVPSTSIVMQGGQSYVWVARGGSTASTYECSICHMHYSAAQAAKNRYRDPMDGGKLVPLPSSSGSMIAHEVPVQVGASDGAWTSITGADEGDQVVSHGVAGLSEGARIVAVPWGSDGPTKLPTASTANRGQKLYRCEKCGMTYSEADAKKNGYVDPMDGGKLVPVTAGGQQ